MTIFMSLGGNTVGDGFLLAPLDSTYDAELALWTDGSPVTVTLQASPNPANLVFSQTTVNITTTPTVIGVHSLLQSASRGDTTIQVLEAGNPVVNFAVTSIEQPKINFNGRFEARFATDGIFPNANPMYAAPPAPDAIPGGWTWGLEGEPNFVPAPGIVPTNLEMPGLGREIRLNNPAALRPVGAGTVPDVVSTIASITGQTSAGPQTFTTGDPLIGQPVNFGRDTYFAGNNDNNFFPGIPAAEEVWAAAREPMGLFEIRLGTGFTPPAIYFRGSSAVGPFVAPATAVNQSTRNPDSRPIANGLPDATAEFNEFGLLDLQPFSETRIDALVADYLAEVPAGLTANRRNLVRRICHLLPSVSGAKATAVQGQAVAPDVFTPRAGTIRKPPSVADPTGWRFKEVYNGTVDADMHAWPGGAPGASSVIDYLRQFFRFDFQWHAFAFHSDELCGYHKGWLLGDVMMTGNSIGDPHIHTVNGRRYDFQAVGEFTLLRSGERMEVQVRQTPVAAANPVPDSHSGLTACVSINTAVAARVGRNQISLQPGREGTRLQFYLDGKPGQLPADGMDLDGNRVSPFDANGEIGLRIDYDDGTVVTATPILWNAYNVWYIDVGVSNTTAHAGIMGIIPRDSWLPRMRDGADVGPMPASLQDRYDMLYKKFAHSWRVTDETSLFVYESGDSTKTFTDEDWPPEEPPCDLKPQFEVPGVGVLEGMPIPEAEGLCRGVIDKDLFEDCVFDVATTGDETFVRGYLMAQDLRLYGTRVEITGDVPALVRVERSDATRRIEQPDRVDQWLELTATVAPLTSERPTPTGTVTFFIDGVPMRRPVELDDRGSARVTVGPLKPGEHTIRAAYSGGGRYISYSGSSPNLLRTVTPEPPARDESQERQKLESV